MDRGTIHDHHSRQSSPTHPSAPAPALDFEARPSHLASFSASYASYSASRPASPLPRSPFGSPRLTSPTKSPLASPSASGHSINQKIPFASHAAAANLQAFAANARVLDSLNVEEQDPDHFYRSFSDAAAVTTTTTDSDTMQSTSASIPPTSSSPPRSPSNGALKPSALPAAAAGTTKMSSGRSTHTNPPSAASGARSGLRSASNPVDDRLGGNGRPALTTANSYGTQGGASGYPPSVKDLTKKFNLSGTSHNNLPSQRRQPRPSTERVSSTASQIKGPSPSVGARAASFSARSSNNTTATTTTTTSSTTATGTSSIATSIRRTPNNSPSQTYGSRSRSIPRPRPKLSTDDRITNRNSQSFANRISKPRNTNGPASRSLPQLSPTTGLPLQSLSRSNGLLFGEILPDDQDSVTAGFGIQGHLVGGRPRRISESSIHDLTRPENMGDMEPSSPTDWYRGAASALPDSNGSTRVAKNHSRAHSDQVVSTNTRPVRRGTATTTRDRTNTGRTTPSTPTTPLSSTSRLPVMVHRASISESHGRSSPVPTRSNSPAQALKYGQTPTTGRSSRQQHASRAKTPATRSNTPTTPATATQKRPQTSNRKAAPSNIATPSSSSSSNNGRLNAYVAVPAPKLSPSLRSSRPRQSVATASTAASRMRSSADRPPSPDKSNRRAGSIRRRKLSVGPIDFAQRRETIKLAYTKTIRDQQAKEAREAAADKRKKDMEAVTRAKAKAEAAALAALPPSNDSVHPRGSVSKGLEEPLKLITNLPIIQTPAQPPASNGRDSPTLGMPGGFVDSDDEPDIPIPQSAISVATAVTEFEEEEQTEAPRPENFAAIDYALGNIVIDHQPPSPRTLEPPEPPEPTPPLASPMSANSKRLSYHSPFDDDNDVDDDDDVSIEIALDTSVQQQQQQPSQPSQQQTPTRGDFTTTEPTTVPARQPDADEYVPQPYTYSSQNYETTVTILGPENDFRPLYKDQARDTMPPSGLHHADEPPLLNETLGATGSGHSHSQQQQQQQREEARVEVENLERLEDFYIGPHLRDNIASLRDSTFTLSDNGDPYEAHPSSAAEYQQTPDSSHSNSLAVPAYLSPGNRLSQHSAWTDFSFGSDDQNAAVDNQDPRDSQQFKQQTEPEAPVSYNNFDRNRSSLRRPSPPSPELSPLDKPPRASSSSMLADKVDPRQSSEFDRDNSAAPQRRIPLVSHQTAPARPAAANNYDDLDESTYEVLSRPNSYPHTQDEEEFGTAIISSPPSAGQFAFEPVDPSHLSRTESKNASSEATDNLTQEQKRLRQRQLVIRELIDTEEIFVRDMSVVEEIYKGTAEACPQLDSKTIKLIFRNTDDIIAFHATFLAQLRDGAASVYQPKGRKSPTFAHEASLKDSDTTTLASTNSGSTMNNKQELDDDKDRQTSLGPLFTKNIDQLKAVHEVFLRTSDLSAKRLIQIQEDDAVKVWLNECSEGARELTAAWSLDSLLIKPMQRLTKYPDIIAHLLKYTPEDHPDRDALVNAKSTVISAIDEINRTKRNFELVGQIVGNRKRKDSDVRAGLARAFGKRVDKLQGGASNRAPEDEEYAKLHERFGDEFLRLQVVLRDVEFYTRSASTYVHEFLQYVTSMELVMRLQPSRDYAHLESRWVQFSVSMRDMEKILDKHLADVRKHVIEPFEQVIKCYQNPGLAIKKRAKRRLDYERYMQLKANGKKIDKTLAEAVEQYEALDDTLKKELPKLSALTAEIGNICLAKFVNIQAAWYSTWKEKVKSPLADLDHVPDLPEIVKSFQRDFTEQVERAGQLAILNPVSLRGRTSQSTSDDIGSGSVLSKTRSRPSELLTPRGRGLSINSDHVPSLPTPDVSGRFDLSPTGTGSALPSPGHYYRDFYSGLVSNGHHSRGNSTAPLSPDPSSSSAPRSVPATHATSTTGGYSTRPTTGRSFDSGSLPRQSTDSYSAQSASGTHHTTHSHGVAHSGHTLSRRGSYTSSHHNYATSEPRRQSGLFHSALPMDDADEVDEYPEPEAGPSGSNNYEMQTSPGGAGMFISAEAAAEANVMWLAASLFEFNIETTKHEGGYPYLTYQAGEIFDVVAEKGELWLAKNQDDSMNVIGWIWSKHFAKLAE